MSNTLPPPVPKNLREQMLKRVEKMDEATLVRLHELDLLAEAIRLREVISQQAEAEQVSGKWEGIEETIRAYRHGNERS